MLRLACARVLAPLRCLSTAQSSTSAPGLRVTERCAARLRSLSETRAEPVALRIAVDGGGCSGFQYEFSVERIHAERQSEADSSGDLPDLIFDDHGATVKVDPISFPFVKGSTVDYVDELISSSFRVVENPNSEATCGCGTSFAAK